MRPPLEIMKQHTFGTNYFERTQKEIERMLDNVRTFVKSRCAVLQQIVDNARENGNLDKQANQHTQESLDEI